MTKDKTMKLKPLQDRVIVRQSDAEEKTRSGIVLPDSAKEKPTKGKVIAVGPGKLDDKGKRMELGVRSGDTVYYGKSSGSPRITKDGVTVSKEIELPQPFENMGAKIVNQVASKTGDVAGDGTTTAVVLAEAIMNEGMKYITSGVNPILVQRGILKAAD